ncbi:SRPBCC family protein [Marinilabiliaceae bacterium ANBcel2]|nr:SRPBCC family protein [Marinilabiliaceae bacterium ANBcel2]
MKRRISTATEIIDFRIDDVWNIITDNNNWRWRSDLHDLKILNDKEFIEYGEGGFQVHFTITKKEQNKIYAFNMDSKAFFGHWEGVFEELSDGKTKITFTESIMYKNLFYKVFASLFINLKSIQNKYMRDLKKRLSEI